MENDQTPLETPQVETADAEKPAETADQDDKDWKAEYEALKAQARKWEERSKENKTQADKAKTLEERLAAIEEENSSLKRSQVVQKFGLPTKFAERLKGSSTDELEADAKEWAELWASKEAGKPANPQTPQAVKKVSNTLQGNNDAPKTSGKITSKEEFLARYGKK